MARHCICIFVNDIYIYIYISEKRLGRGKMKTSEPESKGCNFLSLIEAGMSGRQWT